MFLWHRNIRRDPDSFQVPSSDWAERPSNRYECFKVRVDAIRSARMSASIRLITNHSGALLGLEDLCELFPSGESDFAGQNIYWLVNQMLAREIRQGPILLGPIFIPPVDASQVEGLIPEKEATDQGDHGRITACALTQVNDQGACI